jgi:NADPH2:quinone reductase
MRAVVCEEWCDYHDLKFKVITPPVLKPGSVRIKIKYAGVGLAVSLFLAGKYQRKPPLPFVPGTEVAGIVSEVAPDVLNIKPGDQVVAILDWGGFAEEAVTTAETVYPLPKGLELSTAVSLPLTYGTSYGALHWRARIVPGQILVVHGAAGGVGLAAVELGRLAGARVIATASTEEKLNMARERGAEHAILSGNSDLAKQIKELTGGHGADIIYDPVGGDLFDASLRCIAPEGKIIIIGFASGRIPEVTTNILLVKNAELIGYNFGYYVGWGLTDERQRYENRMRSMMNELFAAALAGKIRPTVSMRYPLERFVEGIDDVMARRSIGRVLLEA